MSSSDYEIPFWLPGLSRPKWVSGIDASITVGQILEALFQNSRSSPKSSSWVLLENWRGVEKALSPSTRILNLWLAWADERPHVRFVVKSRSLQRSPSSASGRRRRSSSIGSQSNRNVRVSDTRHPNKFVVGAQVHREDQQRLDKRDGAMDSVASVRGMATASERDLESVMVAILDQGRQLCDELQRLQHRKVAKKRSEAPATSTRPKTSTTKVTSTAATSTAATSSAATSSAATSSAATSSAATSGAATGGAATPPTSGSESELTAVISELSKLSHLNERLHAKETELHLLNSNLDQMKHSIPGPVDYAAPSAALSVDLAALRAANLSAHTDIDANRRALEDLHYSVLSRRSLLQQLEYDVNVIEKEGRKLTRELDKVQSLSIPSLYKRDEEENEEEMRVQQEAIYKELKALRLECQTTMATKIKEEEEEEVVLHADMESTLLLRSAATASPEGSSSGISSGDSESCNNINNTFGSDIDNGNGNGNSNRKVHFADEVIAHRRLVDQLTWTIQQTEHQTPMESDGEEETLV